MQCEVLAFSSFLLSLVLCSGCKAGELPLDNVKLPPGFHISIFAEVPNARSMTLSPKGTVFVGNRSGDNVYAVVDANQDGKADRVYTIASGLDSPNGVACRDDALYVAENSRILRFDDIETNLGRPPKPVVVNADYPKDRSHGWKFIAFGPDGKLYVPVGAPCNICERSEPIYASITRINPDGTGGRFRGVSACRRLRLASPDGELGLPTIAAGMRRYAKPTNSTRSRTGMRFGPTFIKHMIQSLAG
jgi:glucose/arabinose dehydrogenase